MGPGFVEGGRSDSIGGRSFFLHRNAGRQRLHPNGPGYISRIEGKHAVRRWSQENESVLRQLLAAHGARLESR